MGNRCSARDKVKKTEMKKLMRNATTNTLELYNEVEMAIARGQLNKLNESRVTILERVVSAQYRDADLPLALKMLDDLLTASVGAGRRHLSLDLLAYAVYQPPAFIAKLFAAGANSNATSGNRMKVIFADYFFNCLNRIYDLIKRYPTRAQAQAGWKKLKEGITLFCDNGCQPEMSWIAAIDDVLAELDEKDAPFNNILEDEELKGRQVKLAMDIIRCILDYDAQDKTDTSSRSYKMDRLSSCVQRQRYDLANLLIEYGYVYAFNRSDERDHVDKSDKVHLEELRKIPQLAIGFSKRLERRNRYLAEFALLVPAYSSSNSSVDKSSTTCLFEIPNLLLIIIDHV